MGYHVKNGSYLVQVTRKGIRRTARGKGGEREALQKQEEILADITAELKLRDAEQLLGVEPSNPKSRRAAQRPTLRDFFERRWVEHAKVVQNEQTRLKCEFPFKYLLYYLGDRRLNELLEPSVVNDFVEKMKSNGAISFAERKDGKAWKLRCSELSNATINKALQRLRALLFLAHQEKQISTSPGIDLLPEDDSTAVVAPSEEQLQHLLKTCEDYREVAPLLPEVVEFTAETGLRCAEVFTLTNRSIDRQRNCMRVETQRRVRMVNGRPWRPKHNKAREVPLSQRARAIIDGRLKQSGKPDELVFPSRGGAPYVRMEVASDVQGKGFFRDAVKAAGLKGSMTFHALRHLFAVRLLTRGVPITIVSELLGHSDINLTVKTYGRFSSDARVKWEAIQQLDTKRSPQPS